MIKTIGGLDQSDRLNWVRFVVFAFPE